MGGRGLAADLQHARVIWSAPPVRSAATAHRTPSPCQEQGLLFSTLPSPHRTTKYQSRSGAATTGPGCSHNRRPTGVLLPYSKLIRCNDYPTSASPADATREANTQPGFSGVPPERFFRPFLSAQKGARAGARNAPQKPPALANAKNGARARGRETPPQKAPAWQMPKTGPARAANPKNNQ